MWCVRSPDFDKITLCDFGPPIPFRPEKGKTDSVCDIGGGEEKGAMSSARWGYFRIITGTILGGVLGFYVMHRAELKYKEMWNERLRKYEEEMNRKKNQEISSNEFQESV